MEGDVVSTADALTTASESNNRCIRHTHALSVRLTQLNQSFSPRRSVSSAGKSASLDHELLAHPVC